jgi:general secretion pathway protein G
MIIVAGKYIRSDKGFTLIELLIVVAIIGILASLATVNFMQAQVRAKVARVRADSATLRTGLELYNVDNNAYPIDMDNYFFPTIQDNDYISWVQITTPVDYISSIPYNPFESKNHPKNPYSDREIYDYGGPPNWTDATKQYGIWYLILSAGPNLNTDYTWETIYLTDIEAGGSEFLYDPTNGTISSGDIMSSNKRVY